MSTPTSMSLGREHACGMNPLNQRAIKLKLQQYMYLKQVDRDSGEFDEEFIRQFDKGYCSGISSLWLYSKWLQTQPKTSDNPRDDYDWFKTTVRSIVDWNEDPRSLTIQIAKEFERFISYIQFFQKSAQFLPIGQGNLDKSLEDIHKNVTGKIEIRKFRKEYSVASLFNLDQLKQLLSQNIIRDHRLIHITSHDHTTALFKSGTIYYYFDPNSKIGEVAVASTDKVAELIFSANEFDPTKPSPLVVRMFSMDKEALVSYPTSQQVLDALNPPVSLASESGYANGVTGLHLAAGNDSIESLKYFLNKEADPNTADDNGWTPLMFAIENGYLDIVKELLKSNKIDLGLRNKDNKSAFIIAVEYGHIGVIEEFLKDHNVYEGKEIDIIMGFRIAMARKNDRNYVDIARLLYHEMQKMGIAQILVNAVKETDNPSPEIPPRLGH